MDEAVPLKPVWGDAREGKPFGDADRDEKNYDPTKARPVGTVRGAEEAYQPRGISDATVIKPMYIETEDEPWHFTSRPSAATIMTKSKLEQGLNDMLPFMAAEETMEEEVRKAKSEGDVSKAMEKALKNGARKGSPAYISCEKCLKGFEKSPEDGEKAKPKAPKVSAGGANAGWKGQGEDRKVAKTHDNSVA